MKDYLNISEAAKETDLSIPTIRTKLERGLLPNAHQVQQGKRQLWRIPFNDLIAAGLLDKVGPGPEALADNRDRDLEIRIDKLETELRHALEQLARADGELETYRPLARQHYRSLETREAQEKRRSLWQRLRGN